MVAVVGVVAVGGDPLKMHLYHPHLHQHHLHPLMRGNIISHY